MDKPRGPAEQAYLAALGMLAHQEMIIFDQKAQIHKLFLEAKKEVEDFEAKQKEAKSDATEAPQNQV
jgi:hypothetical protein